MPRDGETLGWLGALLDPWSMSKEPAGHRLELSAGALLHLAEVDEYRDLSDEGLPSFADPARHAPGPAAGYLEGLVLRFLGRHDEAKERFFEVGSDSSGPAGLRLVALIRARAAAQFLLDEEASRDAASVLRELAEQAASSEDGLLVRATAFLQLAQEQLGNDDRTGAATLYEESAEIARSLNASSVADLAGVVQYAAQRGSDEAQGWLGGSQRRNVGHPRASAPLVERRRLGGLAEAFAELADRRFHQALAGPFQQSRSLGGDDRMERVLTASLLQAEAYGSASLVSWSSGALAKYWLARSREEGAPEPAVEDLLLLVQSGDAKAVSRAAQALWSAGPMDVLTKAGSVVLDGKWWSNVERAAMNLLSISADLLGPGAVDGVVDRILSLLVSGVDPARLGAMAVLPPLARALPPTGASSHKRAADALLQLVEARDSETLLDFAIVTWRIRWRDVGDRLRARWVEVASDLLLSEDRGSRTRERAAGALVSLLRSGEDAARHKAVQTFEERPDGLTAAVLLEAGFPDGPERVLPLLVEEVRRLLIEPPSVDPLFGRVFWFTPNPASLLVTALLQVNDEAAWQELRAFLGDDRIPPVARSEPARMLARASGALGTSASAQLRRVADGLLADAAQEGGLLAFVLAFGDVPASLAMRLVSPLLGASDVGERIEGLRSLSYALGPLGEREVEALALPLTYTEQVTVRAEAAAALARLPELSSDARRRVLELLESPGAAVSRAVLRALSEPTDSSPSAVLGDALLVAEGHVSAEVRYLGRRLLEASVESRPADG